MDDKKKSVATQPTYGQRFVKRFPSRHKDPKRAEGQMRGLASLIDFIIPQSKSEVALEAFTLLGLPKPVRKAMSKAFKSLAPKYKDAVMDTFKEGQAFSGEWFKKRASKPEFQKFINLHMVDNAEKLSQKEAKAFFSELSVESGARVNAAADPDRFEMMLSNRYAVADELERVAKLKKQTPADYVRSLGVHEGAHLISKGDDYLGPISDYIRNVQKKSYGRHGRPEPYGYISDEGVYGNFDHQFQDYVSKPTETYARLMQIRHDIGLSPDDMRAVLDHRKLLTTNKAYADLRSVYKAEDIQDMIKNLPAVVAMDMKVNEKKKSN